VGLEIQAGFAESERERADALLRQTVVGSAFTAMFLAPAAPLVSAGIVAGLTLSGLAILANSIVDGRAPREETIRLMRNLHATVLRMDRRGWERGCWKNAARRARWRVFMYRVGRLYADVADRPLTLWFLPGGGAALMQQNIKGLFAGLDAWSKELGQVCNTPTA